MNRLMSSKYVNLKDNKNNTLSTKTYGAQSFICQLGQHAVIFFLGALVIITRNEPNND